MRWSDECASVATPMPLPLTRSDWGTLTAMPSRQDLPPYWELMYPTLRAVKALGGSATGREITEQLIDMSGFSDDELAVTYDTRDKSVLVDRMDWARSYCKLARVLDSPRRGLFLLSELGQELLAQDEQTARQRLRELDRQVRAARQRPAPTANVGDVEETADLDDEEDDDWRRELLATLHRLPPEGFEEFVIFVLKTYGMELERVGGSGDEGIDGIGTAPISPVLSSRVVVQAKRIDPDGRPISRDVVA